MVGGRGGELDREDRPEPVGQVRPAISRMSAPAPANQSRPSTAAATSSWLRRRNGSGRRRPAGRRSLGPTPPQSSGAGARRPDRPDRRRRGSRRGSPRRRRTRQRPGMVEGPAVRNDAGPADPPEGRLEADHAAQARWDADGAAGVRPRAAAQKPAATAAPEPPLEPPGTRRGSQGLRVGGVTVPQANS